jgi:glycosyltransferase involved in cell wall biosynthesis
MKILYFTRGQSPHDLRFLKALAGTNHQVAVLSLEEHGILNWPKGIHVLQWPEEIQILKSPSIEQLVNGFKKIISEYQPDIVHAGPIQRVAYIAALAHASPLLTMSWGSDILLEVDQHTTWPSITRYTLKHSHWFAADCQTVVEKARSFGYQGDVSVFPWGVDLEHFRPSRAGELRERLGWKDQFVFLSNRTMEPLYGMDIVAKAFVSAFEKNDYIRLLLFGKGSQEPEIREILSSAEKEGKVYFGEFAGLDELPTIYNSADVYLSASHSDGSSVSLMEALACGKPVLVSDIPSNREWIQPGDVGWWFEDGNVDDLAEKMLQCVVRENLEEVSSRARKLAEDRADWTKNFAILLDTYQKIFEGYSSQNKK